MYAHTTYRNKQTHSSVTECQCHILSVTQSVSVTVCQSQSMLYVSNYSMQASLQTIYKPIACHVVNCTDIAGHNSNDDDEDAKVGDSNRITTVTADAMFEWIFCCYINILINS